MGEGVAGSQGSVSVVVVAYHSGPALARCLEALRHDAPEAEVIVVDNGSTDGTVELVRECFPAARLIEQENRGLAAGWNTGVRAGSGRYFVILNSDAWAVGDAVERLVEFADDHPGAAVVGPRLSNPDGTPQPGRAKSDGWTEGYHQGRAMLTVSAALRRLAEHGEHGEHGEHR